MSISSDELTQLRAKASDDQILNGLAATDPNDANDIKALKSKGLNSTQILNGLSKYQDKFGSSQQPNTPPALGMMASALNGAKHMGEGLAYGVGNLADMVGATSKATGLGDGSTSAAVSRIAHGIADLDGPYKSAASELSLDPRTWTNIPRAAIESAPYAAALVGAAAMAPEEAGLAAGVGAGSLLHLGQNAEARAKNNGRDTVSNSDLLAAAPGSIAQGAFDYAGARLLGGEGLPKVTGAGLPALKQTAANVARTAGVNAAAGGASNLAGQIGTTAGTNAGLSVDPNEVGQSALASGLAAGAQKATLSLPEIRVSQKMAGLDKDIRGEVARDMDSTLISGNPNDPKDTGTVLTNSANVYSKQTNDALSAAKAQLKALQKNNQGTNGLDEQIDLATNLMTNLRSKGTKLDDAQIEEAKKTLDPSLLTPLLKLNLVKQLQDQAGEFSKPGAQLNSFDALRALHQAKRSMFEGGIAGAITHNPLLGAAWAAAPFVLAGVKGVGNVLNRNAHTVGDFVSRFRDENGPLNGTILPPNPAPPVQPPPQGGPQTPAGPPGLPAPQAAPQIGAQAAPTALPNYSNVIQAGSPARPTGENLPYQLMALRAAMAGTNPSAAPEAPAPQPAPSPIEEAAARHAAHLKAMSSGLAKQKAAADLAAAKAEYEKRQAVAAAPGKVVGQMSPEALANVGRGVPEGSQEAAGGSQAVSATVGALKAAKASKGLQKPAEAPSKDEGYANEVSSKDHVKIDTEYGTKIRHVSQIRKGTKEAGTLGHALSAGISAHGAIRHEITESAKKVNLSPKGRSQIVSAMNRLHVINERPSNGTRQTAREGLREAISGFSEADQAKLMKHFETAKTKEGKQFFEDGWKFGNAEEKAVHEKKTAAIAKARITKSQKKAKE